MLTPGGGAGGVVGAVVGVGGRRRRRRQRKLRAQREHAVRIEAGIESEQRGKAAPEKRRPHQQRNGERDFADHDEAQRVHAASAARRHRAFAQRLRQRFAAERSQRRQPDAHGGGDSHERHERQRAPIGGRRREAGKLHRTEREQRVAGPLRDQPSEAAAEKHQQPALGEEQANELTVLGAERTPQRDLAPACFALREQQAGDVGARDQQHERDNAEQERHRRADLVGRSRRRAATPARSASRWFPDTLSRAARRSRPSRPAPTHA